MAKVLGVGKIDGKGKSLKFCFDSVTGDLAFDEEVETPERFGFAGGLEDATNIELPLVRQLGQAKFNAFRPDGWECPFRLWGGTGSLPAQLETAKPLQLLDNALNL